MKNRWAAFAAILFLLVVSGAQAATSIVSFPDLPDGQSWLTGLTSIFTGSAGLGLGILGLGLVLSMLVAGLRKRKAR